MPGFTGEVKGKSSFLSDSLSIQRRGVKLRSGPSVAGHLVLLLHTVLIEKGGKNHGYSKMGTIQRFREDV